MSVPNPPDASLWNAFRSGDERALERIFLAYYDELYGYGMRLGGHEELIKDCIQDLFQRLWSRRAALGEVEVIRFYLFKALRHEVARGLQAQQRRSQVQNSYRSEFEVQHSVEDFLIAQQLTAEQHARLRRALDQLSSRQREAIYLKFFNDFSYARTAEIMDLNVQSVRNLIHQATRLLRQSLPPLLLLLAALATIC